MKISKFNEEGYRDMTAYDAIRNVEARNYLKGKQNKAAGQFFEKQIEAACLYYKTEGIAHIEKNSEPFRITRNVGNGRFEGFFEKEGQPDYKGTLAPDGKAVCFEAKHTTADRIKQEVVKEHQMDSLKLHQKLGAICFVLVSIGNDGVFRVPIDVWNNMKEIYGRKYLTAADIQEYKVKNKGLVYYFLP